MSQLAWRLQHEEGALAKWDLPDSETGLLLGSLEALINQLEVPDDDLVPVPSSRHDVCTRTCSAKHAIEWTLPARLVVKLSKLALDSDFSARFETCRLQIGLRRGGSGLVRWESPLVALQRAEGFIVARWGDADEPGMMAWRLAPLTTQAAISMLVQQAAVSGLSLGGADAHAAAAADLAAYAAATTTLQAQVARVRSGGEPWTLEERLAKLARLELMASAAEHKQEPSEMDKAVAEALSAGRAELAEHVAASPGPGVDSM
jgi:cell division protein FtsB